MKFHLEIACDNAAFEDEDELPRLLREVAARLGEGRTSGRVRDINGNTVGMYDLAGE
jgi:hypothetical protein